MTAFAGSPVLYLVNGQRQEGVSVADRGLAYGDGLFETMRYKSGYCPTWPLHWQRLQRGAGVLQLQLDDEMIQKHLELAQAWMQEQRLTDCVVKLVVTRGPGGRGYNPPHNQRPTTILIAKPYQSPFTKTGIGSTDLELKSCGYKLSHNAALAGLKHLNRLEQVLAAQSVALSSTQQGLVFDKDDRVIEALHHNLFLVKNSQLFTADLSACGVAGVLRQAILETFAPELGIPCNIGHLYESDLRAADEIFICNGVHGITPVDRWQDVIWGKGTVTRQLMQHLSRKWKKFYDC